mmetsp:Transcript_6885/g.7913  ORF Transcript_6885/g.7913 Transcript_6885/m.7913 type:complete len:463 (-) Transcript_6885:54-1442(-)
MHRLLLGRGTSLRMATRSSPRLKRLASDSIDAKRDETKAKRGRSSISAKKEVSKKSSVPNKVTKKAKQKPAKSTVKKKSLAPKNEPIKREDTKELLDLSDGKYKSVRVVSSNVAGLRGLLRNDERKKSFTSFVEKMKPDILCIQEHKLQEKHVAEVEQELKTIFPNYKSYWSCSGPPAKRGYSGVACFLNTKKFDGIKHAPFCTVFEEKDSSSKSKKNGGGLRQIWNSKSSKVSSPDAVSRNRYGVVGISHTLGKDHFSDSIASSEGRVITVELDHVYVVNAYVPNSGQDLKRLEYRTDDWDKKFGNYLKSLEKKKPVILIGDLNVAYQNEDLHNFYSRPEFPDLPLSLDAYKGVKQLMKQAGCTLTERKSFRDFLELGFVDTFRFFDPNAKGCFTYWSQRANNRPKNRGLRLDYCIASKSLCTSEETAEGVFIGDSFICDDVSEYPSFSDHCPVGCTIVEQ